jgi:hypothetical protein
MFYSVQRSEEKAVMAYLNILSQHSPGWTEKDHENIKMGDVCSEQDICLTTAQWLAARMCSVLIPD